MLADLHAHFPMHLLRDEHRDTHGQVRMWSRRRWQARLIDLISHFANYQGPGDTPSVTPTLMREGDVGVVLSVLYWPLDEMDLGQSYGAPPQRGYFDDILAELKVVEDWAVTDGNGVAVAHSPAELDQLLAARKIALIHCIEGGFQLGTSEEEIRRQVRTLAQRGVAYVTVAHLFWREMATNAPALPFLSDRVYRFVFPQPTVGLTDLGRAAIGAMVDEGILVDITHMSPRSMGDTFELLDERDPDRRTPVIATHMACRFGGLEYCFPDEIIEAVAERDGVLGCILCEHYITSGLNMTVSSYEESVEALCRHIDHIHEVSGSYDNIGIGSDLDGYIKPALPGLEHMGHMRALAQSLRERYGEQDAEKICSGNALRVLRSGWRKPVAPAVPGDVDRAPAPGEV